MYVCTCACMFACVCVCVYVGVFVVNQLNYRFVFLDSIVENLIDFMNNFVSWFW